MQEIQLTPAEEELISSIRNYRKICADSRRRFLRVIEGMFYDLLDERN